MAHFSGAMFTECLIFAYQYTHISTYVPGKGMSCVCVSAEIALTVGLHSPICTNEALGTLLTFVNRREELRNPIIYLICQSFHFDMFRADRHNRTLLSRLLHPVLGRAQVIGGECGPGLRPPGGVLLQRQVQQGRRSANDRRRWVSMHFLQFRVR